MHRALIDDLKKWDVSYKEQDDLSKYSFMKCGGFSALSVFPDNLDQLIKILGRICAEDKRFIVCGSMSNILPRDGLNDVVIIKTSKINNKSLAENKITLGCGALLSTAMIYCAKNSLGGFEGLATIPGTVGGAVYGNSGAFGASVSDCFSNALCYDTVKLDVNQISAKDACFSYRSSALRARGLVLLEACFELLYDQSESVLTEIQSIKEKRRATQPYDFPSLGSVFKRVGGISAGYYIDRCGLKGYRIGGACVSDKHAGFIINLGGASSSDCLSLIDFVRERVFRQFGIELQTEIKIL